MDSLYTIGKLAQLARVNVETVRFYERKGLLEQPRKKGGFRYYSKDYLTRIRFIKRSQDLGFTLSEAQDLLNLKFERKAQCKDVLKKTEVKITEIDKKIKDLKKMRSSLKDLANCCEERTQPLSECPILDCFVQE